MDINDFIFSGVYSCKCPEKYYHSHDNFMWHCRNWTFTPSNIIREPGSNNITSVLLLDTYFNNKSIEVTVENSDDFELIFDKNCVDSISHDASKLYDEDDIFVARMDSSAKRQYFVRKGAKVSQIKLIEVLINKRDDIEREIKHLQRELVSKREEIDQAVDGTHHLLNR